MKRRHFLITTMLCFATSVQALPTIEADVPDEESEIFGLAPHEGLFASSTLAPQCKGKCTYYVQNMADDDASTAWIEGKRGYGIGQYIEFYQTVNNSRTNCNFFLMNGYQKSYDSFFKNTRIRQLKMYVNTIPMAYIQLHDVRNWQSFTLYSLRSHKRRLKFRLEIADIYEGSKWRDTAISEMRIECY